MNLNETPVDPGKLSSLVQLMGGNKGVLFCFTNEAAEKLVFKFQDESPVEALAGTRVVKAAGGKTPAIRIAAKEDYEQLKEAAQSLNGSNGAQKFCNPGKVWKHTLLMEYASGTTIMTMRKNGLDEFLAALSNPAFQTSLGKVLAADVFAGNPDRMFAGKLEDDQHKTGWYHEQNLFMQQEGEDYQAIAIDNAYAPHIGKAMVKNFGVWGRYISGMGFQHSGFAAALPNQAMEQAFLLFDSFLGTALTDHPEAEEQIKAATTHRSEFAANVARSSVAAMKKLMESGQHWKQQFSEDGASEKMLGQFRVRKRMMRQMVAGVSAVEALDTANSDMDYRKWLLQNRYKQTGEEAEELLSGGIEAYKEFRQLKDHA